MKSPSVSLLLGVCVLLLSALTVSAVLAYLPPFPPIRAFLHLAVIIPFFVSTFLMLSIHKGIEQERSLAISMEMVMPERPPGCDEDYEDIDADVTTEHAF
ncbi:unnamed protein product [Oreochromis niloticus]|nr:unnamed protein product [Mustela putorius furo]